MKVTARTSTALVVRDDAAMIRLMGGFALLFGALFVGVAVEGTTSPWEHVVPTIVGIAFGVIGLLALILPATRTFVFDKARRHLFITKRAAFRKPVEEAVELENIAGIDLERTGDDEGDAMFRVALILNGGVRRPWTSYYRSGGAQMRAVVDIVRQFLQLEAPAAPNTAVRLAVALGPAERRSAAWLLAGGIAVCSVFLVIGGRLTWLQESRLLRYVPVEVVVDSTRMAVTPGDEGSDIYRPVVSYHYEVAGRRYNGERVTPLNSGGGAGWARQHLARFRAGSAYTGYVDPTSPADSFLVRERAVVPYMFMALPVFGLIVFGASVGRIVAASGKGQAASEWGEAGSRGSQ